MKKFGMLKRRIKYWWVDFCFHKLMWPFLDGGSFSFTEACMVFEDCPEHLKNRSVCHMDAKMIDLEDDQDGKLFDWLNPDQCEVSLGFSSINKEDTFFDMNQCKPKDKLLSKHGMILEYVGLDESNAPYRHRVKYPDGGEGSRIDDGHVFANKQMRLLEDHDIIGFAP